MLSLFNDSTKVKYFSQIQRDLCNLQANSKDEQIVEIIEKIPKDFLTKKDNLMMICQLFAYNAEININKRNSIKLFEQILIPIKTYLQDESSFLWQILKNQYYLKLWMHDEGLISIEQIIRETRKDTTGKVSQYFLPEIFEKEPEIYSKEIKFSFKKEFSIEQIKKIKELRQKYFKWLIESNDYNDSSYFEIEKDQLRLSIKRDDIDSFQNIISKSNISINSKINESFFESTSNFHNFELLFFESTSNFHDSESSFIDFAIQCGSIKIFKYLIMNDAKICENTIFKSIQSNNYEIIHIIEEMKKEEFYQNSLNFSICLWKQELIDYLIENYEYPYLDKNEINKVEYDQKILNLIEQTFESKNFIFLESFLIHFFQNNNKEFLRRNVYKIIHYSLYDYSGYLLSEFLKYPGINVNYYNENEMSFLSLAISIYNSKAIEILINTPNIDIYNLGGGRYLPFQLVCSKNSELKIVKMFCDFPNYDINEYGSEFRLSPFLMSVINGNTYTMEYLINRYLELKESVSSKMIQLCFRRRKYLAAKILLKIYISNHLDMDANEFLDKFSKLTEIINKEDLFIFYQIFDEVKTT